MPISPVAHVSQAGNGTSSGINTTGSTLLVAVLSDFVNSPATDTVSDSKGNTWHHLTVANDGAGGGSETVVWYAWDHGGSPLSVGSGHTFTVSGATLAGLQVSAWSGTQTVSDPFDKESQQTGGTTTINLPSVTPSANGELIITGASGNSVAETSMTIDSGFTLLDVQVQNNSTNLFTQTAYLVQTSAGAISPTWTSTNSFPKSATLATFKAAPAAAVASTDPPFNTVGQPVSHYSYRTVEF